MAKYKDLADEYEVEYNGSEIKSSNLINKIKDRKLLKLEIEEGNEVRVREITFKDNKAFDDGDLRGAMDETSVAVWWKFWGSGKFDPKKYDKDKESIINFYKKNGYRDAEIISDTLVYSNDKKDLKIVYGYLSRVLNTKSGIFIGKAIQFIHPIFYPND